MKHTLITTLILITGFAVPVYGLEGKIDGETIDALQYALDTVWVILAAILVFFMQAGFAMVESGFTRAKSAVNIMMKNMMDLSIGTISFWAIGFAIMFGDGNGLFGYSGFFVDATKAASYSSLSWSSVPVMAGFIFQAVFAATAATIVSGAVAERIKFSSYMAISALITIIIYPVSGHWGWGGGWLSELGFTDFAGSTIVHSVGGFAALAAAIILGPRKDKFDREGRLKPIPGHNIPLATLGVLILWMGWYGFNPGSTMAADASAIGHIAVTTTLSAAAASLTAFFTTLTRFKRADVGMTLNGALAGLVGITAGCANTTPLGALIIGVLCGILVVFSVIFFDKLKIDDPVGAISVHGVCGAAGTLLLGLFHSESGVLYAEGGWSFFGVQALGVVSIGLWAFISSFVFISIVKVISSIRVSDKEEAMGLDYSEHGASAYPDFSVSSFGSGYD